MPVQTLMAGGIALGANTPLGLIGYAHALTNIMQRTIFLARQGKPFNGAVKRLRAQWQSVPA